jgi:hypothetical protein
MRILKFFSSILIISTVLLFSACTSYNWQTPKEQYTLTASASTRAFINASTEHDCQCSNLQPAIPEPPVYISKNYDLPRFDNITIIGKAHVTISKAPRRMVTVKGEELVLEQMQLDVVGRNLKISLPLTDCYTTNIKIYTPFIKTLVLANGPSLHTGKLFLGKLLLESSDDSDINISGEVTALETYIVQKSGGRIALEWLNSDRADVQSSGDGLVWLAGTVNNLHAILSYQADLDSKYLRVGNAFIEASGNSHAQILPVYQLRAVTSDRSTTYYYQRPQSLNISSKNYSNVLFIK